MKHQSKAKLLEAEIIQLAKDAKIDNWNAFVEELKVPMELYPALQTGRPELLRLVRARAYNEEEGKALMALIAGLIETNMALRTHAERTAQFVNQWGDAFKHLHSVGTRVVDFANFNHRTAADPEDT